MKSLLRTLARRARDRARSAPLRKLVPALAGVVLLGCGAALAAALLWGPGLATATVAAAIATATLVVLVTAWLSLDRQLRAVRAGLDRVEVTQRRILAATELARLEADERSMPPTRQPPVATR